MRWLWLCSPSHMGVNCLPELSYYHWVATAYIYLLLCLGMVGVWGEFELNLLLFFPSQYTVHIVLHCSILCIANLGNYIKQRERDVGLDRETGTGLFWRGRWLTIRLVYYQKGANKPQHKKHNWQITEIRWSWSATLEFLDLCHLWVLAVALIAFVVIDPKQRTPLPRPMLG